MNQWAANGEKQDEKRYGQFWELSGQGLVLNFLWFIEEILRTARQEGTAVVKTYKDKGRDKIIIFI